MTAAFDPRHIRARSNAAALSSCLSNSPAFAKRRGAARGTARHAYELKIEILNKIRYDRNRIRTIQIDSQESVTK